MIPILFGVTSITFLLFNVVIDDPAVLLAGKSASPERLAQIRAELGTDQPMYIQYLNSVKQIFTFDFGRSWSSQQKVSETIMQGIGPSLTLTVPAFAISVLLSICLALGTAFFRGSWVDKMATVVALALMSISSLVYIMVFQNFFGYTLGVFPISGWDSSMTGRWEYVQLPWLIWIVLSLGPNLLVYRTAILDEYFQDYVRTARAKGLAEGVVLFKHVLKNALIPIITIVVVQMPFLITGSLLLEAFFGIPGLGGMLYQAINNSDFPVIRAMVVIGTLLYMTFNLLADLMYAVVNPRVRLS